MNPFAFISSGLRNNLDLWQIWVPKPVLYKECSQFSDCYLGMFTFLFFLKNDRFVMKTMLKNQKRNDRFYKKFVF